MQTMDVQQVQDGRDQGEDQSCAGGASIQARMERKKK